MVSEDVTALEQSPEEVQQSPEAEETQPSVEGGVTVEGAVEQPEGAADGAEAPKTYTQEAWSKRESKLNIDQNELAALQTKVKELEGRQVQADATRQAETQWTQTQQELDKRDASELKAAEDAQLDLTPVKAFQAERRQNAQERIQLQQMQVRMGEEAKVNTAIVIAQRYGLDDPKVLLSAESPKHMETLAENLQIKATQSKVETEVAEANRPAQNFASSVPSPGEGGGDKAFDKAWGDGSLPATPENIARAKKRQGQLT